MLRLTVDFNAVRDGVVRGLSEELSGKGEITTGERILLDDGEGIQAIGVISNIADDLIYAGVLDWGYILPEPETVIETLEPERNPQIPGLRIQGAERQLVPA